MFLFCKLCNGFVTDRGNTAVLTEDIKIRQHAKYCRNRFELILDRAGFQIFIDHQGHFKYDGIIKFP